MKASDHNSEWELEAKNLAHRSAARIWLIASAVVPFFAFFEYGYSTEQFRHFLTIFLCVSAIMLLVIVIQKKFPLPAVIQTYGVSVILGCCFSYMAAKTNVSNVHNYLMGVSAITLVRGMIYFGKVSQLVIVTLFNHTLALTLICLLRPEPLFDIPGIESTLFFGIIFMIFSFVGMNTRYMLTRENFSKSLELQTSFDVIEEKQTEILDSINYAERIQHALLAGKKLLNENLESYFVLFKPKDIVSGDFYWAAKLSNGNFVLVTADSTGHGVPGAIMSIVNIASLDKAVTKGDTSPDLLLNETRRLVIENLKNDGSAEGGKDGMDGSLLSFDFKNKILSCASANNPVWIVRGEELIDIKPDRMPVGKHERDTTPFTLHTVTLQKDDMVYTATDGFADQFGGSNGKKFKYKQLQQLLISVSKDTPELQKQKLDEAFEQWKGRLEQVDDVCLIGVRI
ncbi:MAG: PP2C family protein-serine/threonine phosphatase [Bacteroidia bacterium]